MNQKNIKIDLGKPKAGWVLITIGNFDIRASYITDIPMDILKSALHALRDGGEFSLYFDAENNGEYRILSDEKTFVTTQRSDGKYETESYPIDKESLIAVFINSLKENADLWYDWAYDKNEKKLYNEYVQEFTQLLSEAEDAINQSKMELGNALFGNSRGTFHIDRQKWEAAGKYFGQWLEKNGFDSYGYYNGPGEDPASGGYVSDTFAVRPYYWGDDEDVAKLPNFEYKPLGLAIKWYKYPFRDSYSNIEISPDNFMKILKKCNTKR